MRGSGAADRAGEARARLKLEEGRTPEWSPWLQLLEQAIDASNDDVWGSLRVHRGPATDGAPLLDGALVTLDASAAAAWTRRLIEAASSHAPALASWTTRTFDPLRLLEAGIRQDVQSLETFGADAAEELDAVAAVGQLAVLPVLHACRRALHGQLPNTWMHGCCPVCGGWPTLAELRGLDRTRNLRCGRCGGDWTFQVLRCPFCEETDHAKLGSLVTEESASTTRVDTCRTCRGYVKTFTTLRAIPESALLVEDVATIALDLIAWERGFTRPDRPARRIAVRLAPADSRAQLVEHRA